MRPVSYDQRGRSPEMPGGPDRLGSLSAAVRNEGRRKRFLLVVVLIVVGLMMGAAVLFMQNLFKAEKETALLVLLDDPRAVEALGTPIKIGWITYGKAVSNSETGCARIDFHVSGSIRTGRVFYAAAKSGGRWFVLHESVKVDERQIMIVDSPGKDNYIHTLPVECRK